MKIEHNEYQTITELGSDKLMKLHKRIVENLKIAKENNVTLEFKENVECSAKNLFENPIVMQAAILAYIQTNQPGKEYKAPLGVVVQKHRVNDRIQFRIRAWDRKLKDPVYFRIPVVMDRVEA